MTFWNKLLRRVYLEPRQGPETEHQCHHDQRPIIIAGNLGDIAEQDARKKGTHLSGCVHGATHRPWELSCNINTNRERHRLIEGDSGETQAEQQKRANFRWSKGSKQCEEATAGKTDYSNAAARRYACAAHTP